MTAQLSLALSLDETREPTLGETLAAALIGRGLPGDNALADAVLDDHETPALISAHLARAIASITGERCDPMPGLPGHPFSAGWLTREPKRIADLLQARDAVGDRELSALFRDSGCLYLERQNHYCMVLAAMT